MQKIENISSIEGRKLLHQIFRELRFEKQYSTIMILFITLRICFSTDVLKNYISKDIEFTYKVSFMSSFAVWMEEIVNRFYYTSVLSAVYFGGAVLILIVGLNRFTDIVPLYLVIFSVGFETSMLLIMFFTMAFSPNDDSYYFNDETTQTTQEDLLYEIGEIGRDLAASVTQLEKISDKFNKISETQDNILSKLENILQINKNLNTPNTEFTDRISQTNIALNSSNENISSLNVTLKDIQKEEILISVKNEISNLLAKKFEDEK